MRFYCQRCSREIKIGEDKLICILCKRADIQSKNPIGKIVKNWPGKTTPHNLR